MARIILILAALNVFAGMYAGTEAFEALAPVANSGSGVLAVAFVTGLYTYRKIRAKKDA